MKRATLKTNEQKKVVVPKLEKLKLSSMSYLKQIWSSEITTGEEFHISTMRVVEVESCSRLVNLFPINPMPLLHNLEKVEVNRCNSIEVLFNIDLGRVGKVEEVCSSLRSINVTDSDYLKEVWRIKGADNNSQVSGFQAVENIRIHSCGNFRYVFTPITTNFDMRAHLDTDNQGSNAIKFYNGLRSLQSNNKVTRMAFCVMGSVEKCGMKEDLVKAVENQRTFDLIVKLDIGQEYNIIALQQATAEYIGEALTETTIEARANSLHKRFMEVQQEGKKNILVILDDLWKVLDLKHIGLLSSHLPDGFRLLIISRDENVCLEMGVEKSSILRLGDLDDYDDEGKTLFFKGVGLSKDDDPDLYKIGEEIRMICVKAPNALKVIAPVLKDNIKDKSKWEEALYRLRNHEFGDIDDNVLKIAFEISLKTDDEKEILFLCSVFPPSDEIPVEELMSYAWGLKLFPEVSTLAQARYRTKASVDGLKNLNFLAQASVDGLKNLNFLTEDFNPVCVTMKGEARDYVLTNFTKVKQASFDHGDMPEDDAYESYERIVLDCRGTSEFDVVFNYPNLKLLKLKGEEKLVKFPQNFYDKMESLEVVAYDKMVDPLLPSYSINLRTLCLNSCSFTDDFSFPGNLMNLEILSFVNCKIQKLPSTIGKLKRLKMLKVTGFVDELCVEDGVFQNLVNLEELYMFGDGAFNYSSLANYESRISFTDANYAELETILRQLCALEVELYTEKLHLKDGCFEKLEKFRISMGCRLGSLMDIKNDFENTLELVTKLSEVVECKMNELFEKTERLYLQVKDMKNLADYSFCNLRELEVCDCADLTFLFTVQVASGLTKLEKLKVVSCPVLETLIHGESGGVIVFPKLKSLYLDELPRLTSLCNTENIRVELQELVYLSLDGLPNITSIYPDDAMEAHALLNKQVEIPNLENLNIKRMEKLKQIWPGGSEREEVNNNNNISKLRMIQVWGCDSLENLFPCNPLPLINHLQELEVGNCCSIKVLFNMDLGGARAANMYQLTSSLRRVYISRLDNLREIWRIKEGGLRLIPCFQDVKEIKIFGCRRFRDVFAPKNINFDIRAQVIIKDD